MAITLFAGETEADKNRLKNELLELPFALKYELELFEEFSEGHFLPNPVVTSIYRNAKLNRQVGGVKNSLHTRKRAFDLRNRHYSTDELKIVNAYWEGRRVQNPKLEVITKVHGTGPHIHVGLEE